MSEELTKGLVKKRLVNVGYPKNQDEEVNGVVYYKEDSYKSGVNADKVLADAFVSASKRLTGNEGSPDYTIRDKNSNLLIVIECKSSVDKHQTCDNLDDYKKGLGSVKDISEYAINGAIHYATYLNYAYDVVAVAVSGISEDNYRCTSFYLPKGKDLDNLYLLEDGTYNDTLMIPKNYREMIDELLGKYKEEREKVENELKNYANQCNNYLRANHISAKDRAGFLSAIVLALTNKESDFYKAVERAMPDDRIKKPFTEELGNKAIVRLWESLKDIWKNKDNLPEIKYNYLEEYYSSLLLSNLLEKSEGSNKFFNCGDNILSRCTYSIYLNIVKKMENHPKVDIMGTFYTAFLKYAKGDAKDKGVVLTPKHVTELFCDIAEHFLGKKLDDTTGILDICTGTGGFLISALNKMDSNIDNLTISDEEKKKRKLSVRQNCLIGVEREPEMFALAYANMRFHGDGKSNLYACSSLLKDKSLVNTNPKTTLQEEITTKLKRPVVGMINPPYSLLNTKSKEEKEKSKQSGQSELDFVYSMLEYLQPGGIGIAIVPMSCSSSKDDKKMRETILEHHTLLATMTMPKKLFQESKVGTQTCIMVFKAHFKHKESNKIVFLSRWLNDGFITIPHVGRFDRDNLWKSAKGEWIRQLNGLAKKDNTTYLLKEIGKNDEWIAEAYVETDYSKLSIIDFEKQVKRYAYFRYTQDNDEIDDILESILDFYENGSSKYKGKVIDEKLDINFNNWSYFPIKEIFPSITRGQRQKASDRISGDIPYYSASKNNNGLTDYIDNPTFIEHDSLIYTTFGDSYYVVGDFTASDEITILNNEKLNKYNGQFLSTIIKQEQFRYSFGRKAFKNKIAEATLYLPSKTENGKIVPDWDYMEKFIKCIDYSRAI